MPIKRQEPTTSAARIAANRRSTCSLLKMHPPGSGKTECPIAQLWADVRLCPCPRWVQLGSGEPVAESPFIPRQRTSKPPCKNHDLCTKTLTLIKCDFMLCILY